MSHHSLIGVMLLRMVILFCVFFFSFMKPNAPHLRLLVVSLRDLIVDNVYEAHLPLLVLGLNVKDLHKREKKNEACI